MHMRTACMQYGPGTAWETAACVTIDNDLYAEDGSVAEWLACWTQAQ